MYNITTTVVEKAASHLLSNNPTTLVETVTAIILLFSAIITLMGAGLGFINANIGAITKPEKPIHAPDVGPPCK